MGRFSNTDVLKAYDRMCHQLNPDREEVSRQVIKEEAEFHPLQGEIRFSSHRKVIEFVPAFEDVTSMYRKTRLSVGVISELQDSFAGDVDFAEIDFTTWMPSEEESTKAAQDFVIKPMGPVGHSLETAVFELILPASVALQDMEVDFESETKWLQGYLITLESAMKLAMVMQFEVEDGDFAITHKLGEGTLHWFVYSSLYGSPLAQMVYENLKAGKQSDLWHRMKEIIVDSKCCHRFCDRCILLPRTPEYVLREDLLNKKYLRTGWVHR